MEEPQTVLRLTPVEEQALLGALVLLRRQMRPPFPLPVGKTYNFYIIHNPSTGGAFHNEHKWHLAVQHEGSKPEE